MQKRFSEPGTAPGTLHIEIEPRVERVRIHVICYGPDHLDEREVASVAELLPYRQGRHKVWINVEGVDPHVVAELGEMFGLHPLALEDVINTGQRPKRDEYEGHYFLVMRSLTLNERLDSEQISNFLGESYVITIQEVPGDSFDPVRARLRSGAGRMRKRGPDYLMYALIDALVDEFFPILEVMGERLEDLENEVVEEPRPATMQAIHHSKRDLLVLRRAAYPQREVIHSLAREETPLVSRETRLYLRDTYDHTIQVMDIVETYRELVSGMVDIYLSSLSNKLNEVMKVLTIIATLFIPLTFIAGIYGMNFDPDTSPWNMPELRWYWGYPMSLALMGVTAAVLIMYFRRKGWF
jgi:magnesium transporter